MEKDNNKGPMEKAFPDQLRVAEKEKKTLEEPTPGQPSNDGGYGKQSYTPVIESPERHDSNGGP